MPSFADVNTLRARLSAVEDAIAAAQGGLSYSLGGRSVSRQDLESLRSERTRLMREIKRAQASEAGVRNPSSAVATWT